ncbi:zinc-dependent peptidase [Aporhodopirellula aestuarii]|uniref:Zinc-dependent peptidase n=1 Tax=Aporhodopirellula aestuarii TaxID=2950107 RepID=A0ABT0U5A8_9BACT|nr:zinc-dependent peptidase [Aporhodopirellula aestuarii]MCM2371844.1 zinc-dependent peptidase [Aporhodopirellula aestuarii]
MMLVDAAANARNQKWSIAVALVIAVVGGGLALVSFWWLILLPLAGCVYYLMRRKSRRRFELIGQPFPDVWEATLQSQVEYFRRLPPEQQDRFRNLVKVFLDEVAITGIRTDVDEATRTLVAASAVIPILGFEDFEYAGLGEVLVYPGSFDDNYQSDGGGDDRILGMIGVSHLSGVMILSKPSLISGFANMSDKRNVGIHEFAHLVDKRDGDVDGVPPTIDADTYDPWVRWVGEELRRDVGGGEHIDDYAYTNEAEYFAVLSEYFFEAPALLEKKNPKLYAMMQKMYHQNPKRILGSAPRRRRRIGRNAPCPCGSGDKFKHCCKRKSMRGIPATTVA